MRLTRAWVGIDRLSAHGPQPPRHPCMMHRLALTLEPGGQPTHALIRRVGVWLSESPHPMEILSTLPLGLVVIGCP